MFELASCCFVFFAVPCCFFFLSLSLFIQLYFFSAAWWFSLVFVRFCLLPVLLLFLFVLSLFVSFFSLAIARFLFLVWLQVCLRDSFSCLVNIPSLLLLLFCVRCPRPFVMLFAFLSLCTVKFLFALLVTTGIMVVTVGLSTLCMISTHHYRSRLLIIVAFVAVYYLTRSHCIIGILFVSTDTAVVSLFVGEHTRSQNRSMYAGIHEPLFVETDVARSACVHLYVQWVHLALLQT